MARVCPRCRQFRGRGFHRCPSSHAAPPSAQSRIAPLSVPTPPEAPRRSSGAATASYGAAWATYEAARRAPAPEGSVSAPAPAAARDELRYGPRHRYHGEVATAIDRARSALSTPVDTPEGVRPFDEHAASAAIMDVANRVHRYSPTAGETPVYSAETRTWATRVVNFTRFDGRGRVVSDVVLRDDQGVPRWVRPEVASMLTSARADLRGNTVLREAAAVESQRRVARAALADGLH